MDSSTATPSATTSSPTTTTTTQPKPAKKEKPERKVCQGKTKTTKYNAKCMLPATEGDYCYLHFSHTPPIKLPKLPKPTARELHKMQKGLNEMSHLVEQWLNVTDGTNNEDEEREREDLEVNSEEVEEERGREEDVGEEAQVV